MGISKSVAEIILQDQSSLYDNSDLLFAASLVLEKRVLEILEQGEDSDSILQLEIRTNEGTACSFNDLLELLQKQLNELDIETVEKHFQDLLDNQEKLRGEFNWKQLEAPEDWL